MGAGGAGAGWTRRAKRIGWGRGVQGIGESVVSVLPAPGAMGRGARRAGAKGVRSDSESERESGLESGSNVLAWESELESEAELES